ncbi:MAG: hypothetical protein HYV90_03970 [Candidatus Woesebacteria bacterium]|nr:MAG: hypothetical protein HYV90_03970 [Candidatus Woesebacteria bacterium]
MEPKNNPREEAEYESYIHDLDSTDWEANNEAWQNAAYVVGKKDKKPYQQKLLNAALDKIQAGPATETEGPVIYFVRQLEKRYSSDSNYTDVEDVDNTLNRIVAMEGANIAARKIAADIIFDIPMRLTDEITGVVKKAYESPKRYKSDSFEHKVVELSINAVQDNPQKRTTEGTPINSLYKLFIEKTLKGENDEGSVRRFMRNSKYNWDLENSMEIDFLKDIMNSNILPVDIKSMASKELQ